MTVQGGNSGGTAAAGDAMRQWQAIRNSGDIQFEPLPPFEPPKAPEWLQWIGELLRSLLEPVGAAIGLSWPLLENVLIATAILLLLLLIWKLLKPLLERSSEGPTEAPSWTPDREAAISLLETADRLAADGRYGEAVHLLLRRSVDHIAQAQPEWLLPASTAREIAAIPLLPERARSAFREIAVRVERSLFALRALDAEDWRISRAAYAEFALAELVE